MLRGLFIRKNNNGMNEKIKVGVMLYRVVLASLFLCFSPHNLFAQNPVFLFQEDCNQDLACVNGILAYSEWRLIKTKVSLWDEGQCNQKICENYFFNFDSLGTIYIHWARHKGRIINEKKFIQKLKYEIFEGEEEQHYLRIFGLDPHIKFDQNFNKKEPSSTEYIDFQFLFSNRDQTLALRYNAKKPEEKSVSFLFIPFIPKGR